MPKQQPTSDNANVTELSDLLGPISRTDLQKAPFNEWFESEYQTYEADPAILANIDLNEIEVLTFMGTWCSDSQREVPHLLKILDQLNFPKEKINIIAVDEDKANPPDVIKKWGIEYVPTIILIRNGLEIGRVVEAPTMSLEKDMASTLSKRY